MVGAPHRTGLLFAGVVLLALLAPRLAEASDADALFKEGREAATRGDYALACAKFAASYALEPAVGTSLNIGDCNDHLGHLVIAMSNYESAIARMAPNDPRNVIAKKQLAQLDRRIARVTFTLAATAPSTTRLRIDGVELDPRKLGTPEPADPGRHRIVVVSPGRRERVESVSLAEGQRMSIELSPGDPEKPVPSAAAASTATASQEPTSAPPAESGSRRTIGLVIGGLGAAALAAGAVTGLMATNRASTFRANCTGNRCNQTGYDAARSGSTLVTLTDIEVGVGLAAVAAGVILVLTSPSRAEAQAAFVALRVRGLVLATSGTTATLSAAF